MFFIFLFSLALKIVIDNENYKSVYQKSFEIPVFFLIYSPYCPHCKAVHPTWEELMNKYENDQDILIGECDFIAHRQECDFLYRTDSFPTFTTLVRGKAKRISPTRNIESFTNEVESLKKIDFSLNCSVYQTEFSGNYPAYLISGSQNSTEKCKIVSQIQKIFPKARNYLYIDNNSTGESRLTAILSNDQSKEYTGPKEKEPFIEFMKETRLIPFGDWNLTDAMDSKNKIGLFIHSNNQEFIRFGSVILNFLNNFTLSKVDLRTFKRSFPQINLTEISPPAFAISNTEKTKFYIIPGVLRNPKVNQLLNDALNDFFDELIEFDDLLSLFTLPPTHINPRDRKKIHQLRRQKNQQLNMEKHRQKDIPKIDGKQKIKHVEDENDSQQKENEKYYKQINKTMQKLDENIKKRERYIRNKNYDLENDEKKVIDQLERKAKSNKDQNKQKINEEKKSNEDQNKQKIQEEMKSNEDQNKRKVNEQKKLKEEQNKQKIKEERKSKEDQNKQKNNEQKKLNEDQNKQKVNEQRKLNEYHNKQKESNENKNNSQVKHEQIKNISSTTKAIIFVILAVVLLIIANFIRKKNQEEDKIE